MKYYSLIFICVACLPIVAMDAPDLTLAQAIALVNAYNNRSFALVEGTAEFVYGNGAYAIELSDLQASIFHYRWLNPESVANTTLAAEIRLLQSDRSIIAENFESACTEILARVIGSRTQPWAPMDTSPSEWDDEPNP